MSRHCSTRCTRLELREEMDGNGIFGIINTLRKLEKVAITVPNEKAPWTHAIQQLLDLPIAVEIEWNAFGRMRLAMMRLVAASRFARNCSLTMILGELKAIDANLLLPLFAFNQIRLITFNNNIPDV
jgi:hypothetical protein